MDKGKSITLEGDEAFKPRDVEAGSFMASVKGLVAHCIASTRHPVRRFPTFVEEVLPTLKGLDPCFHPSVLQAAHQRAHSRFFKVEGMDPSKA